MPKGLVCDDDDSFRCFIARVLELNGWQVEQAAHGDEALTWLETGDGFDLVMVDLLMPVRSGWEVIDFLRRHPRYDAARVIAVTGLAPSPEDRRRLEERGVEVWTKDGDFSVEQFMKTINRTGSL